MSLIPYNIMNYNKFYYLNTKWCVDFLRKIDVLNK